MALSRKSLKAMGLTDEQIESVIDMHSETVNDLKDKISDSETAKAETEKYKTEAEKLRNELEKANKTIANSEKYKEQYENTKKEYETYKTEITAKEVKAAKEKAVANYFRGKNVRDDNIKLAMRCSKDEIGSIEIDENGKIKDTKALDDLLSGDLSKFVSVTKSEGATVEKPPTNTGGNKMTKAQIMAIKDDSERQQAIKDNLDVFGYDE